ncbi:MAG: helix-turn-helix domain-containing protein [Candidatus Cybelea sp.]|jgi:transcriptional regulator with XRE-family HTH domain
MPNTTLYSPAEITRTLGAQAKARRLALGMRQVDLAAAAGVPITTVRRFEAGHNVGLDVVVNVALALRAEHELLNVFTVPSAGSIDDVLRRTRQRQRARA